MTRSDDARPAGPGAAAETAATASSPAPSTPPPGGGGALDATALRRLWPEVLEVVKQSSRRTRALVDNAQIASVTDDTVRLEAPSAALAKMLAEDSNTEVLKAALTKVVGGTWRFTVTAGAGDTTARPAATAATRSAPVRPASVEPDPRDDSDPSDEPSDRPVVDPEQEALRLLRDELGARPLDAS